MKVSDLFEVFRSVSTGTAKVKASTMGSDQYIEMTMEELNDHFSGLKVLGLWPGDDKMLIIISEKQEEELDEHIVRINRPVPRTDVNGERSGP